MKHTIFVASLLLAGCPTVGSASTKDTAQASRTVCVVDGAKEARSGMYDETEVGEVLMQLERDACDCLRRMIL
tara:strand:+ start:5284 stop:5502 length:219 start_codon:yes stop_codon:yes gene_type:complete